MSQPTPRAEGQQPSPARAADRRATVRFPSSLLSSLHAVGAKRNDSWSAEICDVSAAGLGLRVRRRFERGALLAVEPVSPGAEAPTLMLVQVVHATARPGGHWLLGCRLVRELSESEVRALQ
jgi:hypothetical protein